ncbi:MAG: 5-oxoprolinase subunit B family protein, partial [Vulcanimicrobiaceae bacterium]
MRSENSPWQAIYPVGDGALLLEFGAAVDLAINQRVHRVARALHAAALPGVWGIVPAFAAILVEFDPLVTDRQTITAELGDLPVDDCDPAPRCFIVPAWYGGEHGPDLAAVADQLGRTPDEIICAHAAIEHRIFCIGFAPGQP